MKSYCVGLGVHCSCRGGDTRDRVVNDLDERRIELNQCHKE